MKNIVLIVDDNTKNLQLMSSILNPFYQLLLANTGEKAIKTAELKMPDLILLDIMMPGLSGFDVCRILKENEKTREIPIIFLTAKTEESDISAAFEAGGVDYITKPIKIKEVLVRIKTHLNLKEARETQQKQNEELKKIVANRDKFFSIIAHDLKSPFQSFIGLTEVMAEQINNFSKAELIVSSKELNTCANNFFKLLTNLLEWARMQQGVLVFNPVEINLSEAVIRNINLIIKRGEQKGIEVITEVPENQKVYADQDMFNSILSNLLSNALKFTNRGGEVRVQAKELENNTVEVVIKDNGIGMPESFLKRIFKVEEKVGRIGTEGEKSTGLGLLLCKEFIEKNGGRIRAESRENIGSTFYFTLHSAVEL